MQAPPPLSFSLLSLSAHSYQWSYCQSLTHTNKHTEHSPNKNLETQQMPKQKYIALCECECVCARKHFDSANHAHCTFMQTLTPTATLAALLGHCNQCAALIAKFFKWFFAQPFCSPSPHLFALALLLFLFGSRQREELRSEGSAGSPRRAGQISKFHHKAANGQALLGLTKNHCILLGRH